MKKIIYYSLMMVALFMAIAWLLIEINSPIKVDYLAYGKGIDVTPSCMQMSDSHYPLGVLNSFFYPL